MPFSYSYPRRASASQIESLLSKQKQRFERDKTDLSLVFPKISEMLTELSLLHVLPNHQIQGWLRIAAAFRKAVKTGNPNAPTALAALEFLDSKRKRLPNSQTQMALNWVLDSSLCHLDLNFEGGWIKDAMTDEELSQLQSHIEQNAQNTDFNQEAIKDTINHRIDQIKALNVLATLTNLDRKIETLIGSAQGEDRGAQIAKSALNYVASLNDVIHDDSGILGLLDDLYVIEWAYAVVEKHAHGLPMLDEYQRRWPHIESSYLMAGGRLLDRFAQYVIGSAHQMMREKEEGSVVLRDSSAFIVPIVASCALQNLRQRALEDANVKWPEGAILNLLDFGKSPLHVRFLDRSHIGDKKTLRIEAAQSARLHIPIELEGNIELANRDYQRLSKGNVVEVWKKEHAIDPLHFLLSGRPRGETRRPVLVVASKLLLDHFLPTMQCRGEALAQTVGANWVTSVGREEPFKYSTNKRAMVYACASAETAKDLIMDPPVGVAAFDVVVHGSEMHRQLKALMTAEGVEGQKILSICDLAERPGPGPQGMYLQDMDVLPYSDRVRGFQQSAPSARGLARQYNHWVAHHKIHEYEEPNLAKIGGFVEDTRAARNEEEPGLVLLGMMLRRFLFDAGRFALPGDSKSEELCRTARDIARYARTQANFDPRLKEIADCLSRIATSGPSAPEIFSVLRHKSQENLKTVVLATSKATAVQITERARAEELNAEGINLQDLILHAPFDHLIVPGWFGAEALRKIQLGAPAIQTDFMLFSFQRSWFDNVMQSAQRREKTYVRPLTHFADPKSDRMGAVAEPSWPVVEEYVPVEPSEAQDFVPVVEDAHDLERVLSKVSYGKPGQTDCTGLPVLSSDMTSFVLLPPHGTVIVIPDDDRIDIGETDICVSVEALQPGQVFALKDGSHLGLLDELSQFFLEDPEKTMEDANMWRKPLIAAHNAGPAAWRRFKEKLFEAGLARADVTYNNWLNGDTIAPRDYSEVIPLLCRLSEDPDVRKGADVTIKAVTKIYKARSKATHALTEELAQGKVDWENMRMDASFGSRKTTLDLFRVAVIGQPVQCLRSEIGRVGKLEKDMLGWKSCR